MNDLDYGSGRLVSLLLLALAFLVMTVFVRFPSTKSNEHDRMSGGGW